MSKDARVTNILAAYGKACADAGETSFINKQVLLENLIEDAFADVDSDRKQGLDSIASKVNCRDYMLVSVEAAQELNAILATGWGKRNATK